MTNPRFELAATGSGEVRDQDGNLVNQENADEENK